MHSASSFELIDASMCFRASVSSVDISPAALYNGDVFFIYGALLVLASVVLAVVFILRRKRRGAFWLLICSIFTLLLSAVCLLWAWHAATFTLIVP